VVSSCITQKIYCKLGFTQVTLFPVMKRLVKKHLKSLMVKYYIVGEEDYLWIKTKFQLELVVLKVEDMRNATQVSNVLKTAIGSHLYDYQDMLAPKIANACIQVCPKVVSNFNVDNVRVAKIVGGGVSDTEVVKGFVLTRGAEGMCLFSKHLSFLTAHNPLSYC
jgi:hypothetical protein